METESSSSLMSNSTDDSTSVFNPLFEKLHRLCDELDQDTREIQETINSTNGKSSATHYLWTPATSGDKSVLLPIDTSTPKSLVSSSHADFSATTIPSLCPSTSDNAFTLSRHGKTHTVTATINIPIRWSNGKVACFEIFVIDDLSTPVILGSNHLIKTYALFDFTSLKINFRHPQMNYWVNCFAKTPD